MKFGGML